MTWQEQDWSDAHEALDEAVKRLRRAQRTMLDRELSEDDKRERINRALHGARGSLDECAWIVDENPEVVA